MPRKENTPTPQVEGHAKGHAESHVEGHVEGLVASGFMEDHLQAHVEGHVEGHIKSHVDNHVEGPWRVMKRFILWRQAHYNGQKSVYDSSTKNDYPHGSKNHLTWQCNVPDRVVSQ